MAKYPVLHHLVTDYYTGDLEKYSDTEEQKANDFLNNMFAVKKLGLNLCKKRRRKHAHAR